MILSRRSLIRGAGVSLALPLLDAMSPGRPIARAQDGAPPKRIVFLCTPNGIEMSRWKVDLGTPDRSRTVESRDFALSPTLAALAPIRDRCLFVEGVPMTSAGAGPVRVQGHPKGTAALFTGGYCGAGEMYGGGDGIRVGYPSFESVDNMIARHLDGSTRFRSMYLGVRMLDNPVARRVFYQETFSPLAFEQDPARALGTLIDDLTGTALERERTARDRRDALETSLGEFRALRCQVSGPDRERLDQHMDHLMSLVARLGEGTASCEAPVLGELAPGDFSRGAETFRAHLDVVATALACDLTRVVGLQFGGNDADGGAVYQHLGHDLPWHDITHLSGTDPHDRIEAANRWAVDQMMYLVNRLRGMREADGTSVFDSTTIVWASEIGNGWTHDTNDVAWTIIDGSGYFDTGRYVRFPGTDSTAHNRLLLHFLRMFGNDTERIGHPELCDGGPLPGLAR
ncbi:MAG: DUF1552 domain-containing protein [Myxococcota bacterium]|nr:DUF1552 domain-containing protein [Myxococcota bacterium]